VVAKNSSAQWFTAGLAGYGCEMREDREQVAGEARNKVREEKPEDTAMVVSGPHAESVGLPTGEERAAKNRDEDPPA
jgi:hypothetical protein